MTNIEEEVMAAYSDCNQESYKYGSGERNLHFRASEQVSVDEAIVNARVLGYNFPKSRWYKLSYNLLKKNNILLSE